MKIIFSISMALLFGTAASAQVIHPEELNSRALQQARRVASMEKDREQPSRAVWLGQRVAKNFAKLSVKEERPKQKKKGP